MLDTFAYLLHWHETQAVTQPQKFGHSSMEEHYDYTARAQLVCYVRKPEEWA